MVLITNQDGMKIGQSPLNLGAWLQGHNHSPSLVYFRSIGPSAKIETVTKVVALQMFQLSVYLFIVLRRFQHCTGHITTGSWKGRGNQYIEFVRVLYCKLPTNGKQLPAFPLEAVPGIEPWPRGGKRECYHSATVAPSVVRNRCLVLYN